MKNKMKKRVEYETGCKQLKVSTLEKLLSGWGCGSVVEYVFSVPKAQGSSPQD
jgi:hypothetical protein